MIHRLSLLALLTTGLLRAETFRDAYEQTRPLDPHGLVRIENANGSITIRTWNRPEVLVQVEKRASSEDYLKEIGVAIDSDPRSLSITTTFPHHLLRWLWNGDDHGEVRLVLTVPETVDLRGITSVNGAIAISGVQGEVEAHTVNGTVTIDSVHGALEAHTVNGAIHATDVRSNAVLSTINGAIHAEVTALGSSGHLHFSTINGSIAILLARNADATFRASTVNGGTSCDLPIRLTEEGHHRGMQGVIGAGGGSITTSTVNGSVRLESL
jgi:hypothetical protein